MASATSYGVENAFIIETDYPVRGRKPILAKLDTVERYPIELRLTTP